jgi:membrane associated rhomboid family serine protease
VQVYVYALKTMAPVEVVLGRALCTVSYQTSGVAGAFASFPFSSATSPGASGAVLGIFGAC